MIRRLFIIFILVSIGFCAWMVFSRPHYNVKYAEYQSLDHEFKLEVYVSDQIWGFPGQSGDRPARVQLVNRNGQTIHSMNVEMAQLIDEPEWTPTHVSVKLFFDWPLPTN